MKKINFLAIALITVLFASCGKAYEVSVKIDSNDMDGKSAYIYALNPQNMQVPILVDSATIKGDKVSFGVDSYANIELPVQAVLSFQKLDEMTMEMPEYAPVMFFMEKGNVKIEVGKENKQSFTGTPANDKYNSFIALTEKAKEDPTSADQDNIMVEAGKAFYDIISSNIDNNIGATMILSGMPVSFFDAKQSKALLAVMTDDFKNKYPQVSEIVRFLENKAKSDIEVITDAELVKADGTTAQLTELVKANKYTLIDFWASWCGPCIKEVPHLKAAYADFKSKGFEIVGISVDQEADDWQKAIKEHEMSWLHFNDTKEDGVATQYGVIAIPHTLLVDSEGKVVAMNLRGDALTKKLAELLN